VKRLLLLLALSFTTTYFFMPGLANAQMFSVQPERQTTAFIPDVAITVGYSAMSFDYRGPNFMTIIPGPGQVGTTFQFSEALLHLGIDMPGFSAYGLFGRGLGEFNNSYSQVGASIGNQIPLIRSSAFRLSVPLRIATDYIIVSNNNLLNSQEFKQNTFGIHGGIDFAVRLAPAVRFEVAGMAGYSYSVSGFGNSGGTASDLSLKNRLYFDNLVRQYGMLIGFDLNSRKYDLEDNRYDHLALQQMVTIGVTF
jgi:hypothetical protein